MSDAGTRAHVVSPTTASLIPATDLHENVQASPPEDSDYSSDEPTTAAARRRKRKQLRKEERKQEKQRHDSALPTPTHSDTETPTNQPRKSPDKSPKQSRKPVTESDTPSITIPREISMAKPAAQTAYPLLVASIGNPGSAYANTLHSAGHIVTSALAEAKRYDRFQKGLSGLVSRSPATYMAFGLTGYRRTATDKSTEDDWTLWQSTSLMNVSGNGVLRAYNEWLRGLRQASGSATLEGRLVVVHDELESALGKVTIRDGGASAKGHNGLKSCQQSLGGVKWWRVGVGIGRPESRDPDVVSKYVLGKMTSYQRAQLEKTTIPVYKALEDIAAVKK